MGKSKDGKVLWRLHISLNESNPPAFVRLSILCMPILALLFRSPSCKRIMKCLMSSLVTNPVFSQSNTAKHTTIKKRHTLSRTPAQLSILHKDFTYDVAHLESRINNKDIRLPRIHQKSTPLHCTALHIQIQIQRQRQNNIKLHIIHHIIIHNFVQSSFPYLISLKRSEVK
jgi:hypothetical protein